MIMKRIIFKSMQPNDYFFQYYFTEGTNLIIMFGNQINYINNAWRMDQWKDEGGY